MIKIPEELTKNKPQRAEYYSDVLKWLDKQYEDAKKKRIEYTLNTPIEKRAEDFKKQLGFPLWNSPEKNEINVKSEILTEDEKFTAYDMQLEVLEGVHLYGIYFKPKTEKKNLPFVILQHGGAGVPEIVSGLIPSDNYNNFGRDLIESGYCVFAPQLMLWYEDRFGSPYNKEAFDIAMKQLGGSKTAFEVYCLTRAIDYFETLPEIDKDRIGMAGLSYGGMYTLITAAAEPRIKVAVSSCFVNDRRQYAWSDWSYVDQANTFFDPEVMTLISPRHLFVELGTKDALFDQKNYGMIKSEYEYYKEKLNLPDNCTIHLFEGEHEFARDEKNLEFIKKYL